jgi:3-deoxy-D-manno-octulosonic-acid transferase
LLAGTLQPRSARLWPLARPLYRNLFNLFAHLGVCTEEDRYRFVGQLGVRSPVTVTGDTRAEQVIRRYESAATGDVAVRLQRLGGTMLVLGSTWPPDERIWLPILPDLLERFDDLRVVLAPHEPTPERLADLEGTLARQGTAAMRLSRFMADSEPAPQPVRCILVDSVGVLAEIYRAGDLAYVGGSLTTGVHNTMEPAICGMPVLFGPVIQNAVEAGVLVRREAGFIVKTAAQAADRAVALLSDPEDRARRGQAARDIVLSQRGATEKSLALLAPYL